MSLPYLNLANGDCLDFLPSIPDAYVDLIILDLPYAKIASKWDVMIDVDALWSEFRRILKPTGTVLMFGVQPFSTKMAAPAIDMLKYGMVWEKGKPTLYYHAKNRPLPVHEDILVFSNGVTFHGNMTKRRMTYNPIGSGSEVRTYVDRPAKCYKERVAGNEGEEYSAQTGCPRTILRYDKDPKADTIHETQKPAALLERLIEMFSNPGDLVLDPTFGSGSTGIAAMKTGRDFIGIELEEWFFQHGGQRIENARAVPVASKPSLKLIVNELPTTKVEQAA